MKRNLSAVIIIIAILSGMPEAMRQFQTVSQSGAAWLKGKMFEGIINSAEVNQSRPDSKRCESGANRQTAPDLQLIGKINLGAHVNVF